MTDLPQTYSATEVCEAFGITKDALDRLVKDGKVGFFIGRRARRFMPEHVAQIRAAIEIRPKAATDLTEIGVTRRGAARRRSS